MRFGRRLKGEDVDPVDAVELGELGDQAAVERDVSGAGWSTTLIIGVVLTLIVIILALQNTENARFEFLGWDTEAPLVVLLLAAVLVGVVFDEIAGLLWRYRRRRQLADSRELAALRATTVHAPGAEPDTTPDQALSTGGDETLSTGGDETLSTGGDETLSTGGDEEPPADETPATGVDEERPDGETPST